MHNEHDLFEIAQGAGIPAHAFIPYGRDRAKIDRTYIESSKLQGKLVLVTAMSPTPPGEGKTTTSIGLADGLRALGKNAVLALREPSLGPIFGIKGGAIGGGKAQVTPATNINLHFNGDFAAITAAQNLLAAMTDNALHFGTHNIDPRTVVVRRALDMNDRALRNIVVGIGGKTAGVTREAGFDITAASEVMATFCLASSLEDLRTRLGGIHVGYTYDGQTVTADDIDATNAMVALLVEAFSPNLVRTLEGTPAFIHGGPFANIAHGCNSVMATRGALATGEIVVTEAGFGADLGAEKFIDIKCRNAGIQPDAAVCVVTIRAIKYHGGVALSELEQENLDAVKAGFSNARRHVENLVKLWGQNVVVAINRFYSDTDKEIELVMEEARKMGVRCAVSEHYARGGEGATNLANAVLDAIEEPNSISYTYDMDAKLTEKIDAVVHKVYGGGKVTFTPVAKRTLAELEEKGYGNLPVCIAKTPASFSADAKVLGAPSDFEFPVREVRLSSGGGFVVVISGTVMLMPGLPKVPSAVSIRVDEDGTISGIH
ncbi:formate--tetrahydrofolate ligase [Actinotignum urinale]|uniref:formate--tetrahydrofolate ligase n=1 Tax=Actinotignum urinale TaxID=190146 RepID=UPI0003B3AE25|nr:formate--tetrahydrofolate ligase [Actinotignum urinale]MDY5161104.1 formate--tetrahydrofolate ligase [Actinotignum urinale]WIK59452.1 formate--tetrahydrofolate ligase [Actinotignum urinale]